MSSVTRVNLKGTDGKSADVSALQELPLRAPMVKAPMFFDDILFGKAKSGKKKRERDVSYR
jgi:hypothetical protein